jgi:hypothetical protein
MKKIEKLEELKVGALYFVITYLPFGEMYEEYEDLLFNGAGGEQLSFTDQNIYKSSPDYGKPMFIEVSAFKTGKPYSLSIYEQE